MNNPTSPLALPNSPSSTASFTNASCGIVSALATNDSLSFNDLKRVLKTTDGNLSVHARKNEEAQYISCVKFFEGRVPRTEYRLTAAGRRALTEYLNQMERRNCVTREQ